MAGDWVPWCKGLSKKPEVLAIAKATGHHRRWVAATLMEFWEWADAETETGDLPGVSVADLQDFVSGTDERFWLAVSAAGWLIPGPDGLTIPNFGYWMGKAAKKRLRAAIRKRLSRLNRDKDVTTGQERTGENNPPTPQGGGEGDFEKFWGLYPRKEDEDKAREAWQELDPDPETMAAILSAIPRQRISEEWRRECGRYIPRAHRYIRARRWRDELPPANGKDETPQERAQRIAGERAESERLRDEKKKNPPRKLRDALKGGEP
jgi:hypothetical protein